MIDEVGPGAAGVLRATSGDGGTSVLSLRGEHDLSNAASLRQDLLEVADRTLVVLDLTSCSFLDSTVLGVLAAAGRRLRDSGGRLVGVGAQGMVGNALRVTAMTDLLLDRADLDPDVVALIDALHSERPA
jgi:anti-anti-sigma factor